MKSNLLLVGVLLAFGSACAPRSASIGAADEDARATRDRNLITTGDIEADPSLRTQSVLDVIRSLRPQFLTNPGTQSYSDPEAGLVHASINGTRVVSVSELGQLHAREVHEIRLLTAAQAMQKFGGAARRGPVILVTTVKMP